MNAASDARLLAREIDAAMRFAGVEIGKAWLLAPALIACTLGLLALLGATFITGGTENGARESPDAAG